MGRLLELYVFKLVVLYIVWVVLKEVRVGRIFVVCSGVIRIFLLVFMEFRICGWLRIAGFG